MHHCINGKIANVVTHYHPVRFQPGGDHLAIYEQVYASILTKSICLSLW